MTNRSKNHAAKKHAPAKTLPVTTAATAAAALPTKTKTKQPSVRQLRLHVYDSEAKRLMTVMLRPDALTVQGLFAALEEQHAHTVGVLFANHRIVANAKTVASLPPGAATLADVLNLQRNGCSNAQPPPVLWTAPSSMQIFVKTETGECVPFEVNDQLAVEGLKLVIEASQGIRPTQQRLFFAGRRLQGGTLGSYLIQNGSTLQLMRQHRYMQIFVKTLSGMTFALEVTPSRT